MMNFEEDKHLHVGFYDNGFDLEGIFLKVKKIDKWCLFFNTKFYNITMKNKYDLFDTHFGYMVREYKLKENDLTHEKSSRYLKEFLLEEGLI